MTTLTDLGADPRLTNEDNSTALMLVGGKAGTDEEVLAAMQLALDLGVVISSTSAVSAAIKNGVISSRGLGISG